MASVNKVIIVGRLGQDPDVRVFQNGDKIANLSIATSERWTDKATGEPREQTEWHRVVLLGKVAGTAEQYLRKGSSVYIEGSLHTRKYTGQDGIERYTTEIKSYTMQMLGGRTDGEQQGGYYAPQGYQGQYQSPQQFAQQPAQGQQQPQQRPIGTQSSLYQPMPPHNQMQGQPKAITPPVGGVPNDCPF